MLPAGSWQANRSWMLPVLYNLLNLLVPAQCVCCSEHLGRHEKHICIHCNFKLPLTDFNMHPNNTAAMQLWGRVKVNYINALYYYQRGTNVQQLVHYIKYKNGRAAAKYYGRLLGRSCMQCQALSAAELLVPVPLHKSRMKERGYNQSELISVGMAEEMGIPVNTKLLLKHKRSSTQTARGRLGRMDNVEDVYKCNTDSELTPGSHILLVDDIMTTGATLEACVMALNAAGYNNISIALLAFTRHT